MHEFYENGFEDWDEYALEHLESYRKFTETIRALKKGVHYFYESEKLTEIRSFKNREAMKEILFVAKDKLTL